MRYCVLGDGISGRSAKAFLRSIGEELVGEDEVYDVLVTSPGIPPSHPLIQNSECVIGEAELGCRHLKGPAVGITGTNGKTTATLLVTHVLQESGRPARALGNIGKAITSDVDGEGIAVVELSSFQLETMGTPVFDCAAILNITPDHLDRYENFEAYRAAKERIALCLKGGAPLFRGDDAARKICSHFGVSAAEFDEALKTFQRPPHRMEVVLERDGITYINDSKATNVASVIHAVDQMEGPICLIAGGVHKGSSYYSWIGAFQNRVKCVCLVGEATDEILRTLPPSILALRCGSLEEAIEKARGLCPSGGNVLLSPGCSSYDMFDNFEARGDAFRKYVMEGAR